MVAQRHCNDTLGRMLDPIFKRICIEGCEELCFKSVSFRVLLFYRSQCRKVGDVHNSREEISDQKSRDI